VNVTAIVRYVILVLSSSLVVLGVAIIAGLMVPRSFPGEYRLILGAVVLLYGVYRFAIAYYRRPKE
jgi:hypothetical protein